MNVIDSTKQALLLGVDELMDIMFYGHDVIFKHQLYKVSPSFYKHSKLKVVYF